jgi:DNA (cytosine-5)-methyltransferase 1
MRIRRLTPLECERLMAYPDNWTAEGTEGKISDTQRYKMCGNGVVSNCVEEIVRRLLNNKNI